LIIHTGTAQKAPIATLPAVLSVYTTSHLLVKAMRDHCLTAVPQHWTTVRTALWSLSDVRVRFLVMKPVNLLSLVIHIMIMTIIITEMFFLLFLLFLLLLFCLPSFWSLPSFPSFFQGVTAAAEIKVISAENPQLLVRINCSFTCLALQHF